MLKLKGTMDMPGMEISNRVYDRRGACPTVNTCGGATDNLKQ